MRRFESLQVILFILHTDISLCLVSPRGPVVPRVPPNVPSLPPFTGAYARVMLSPQTRDSAISPATSPRELSTASALSPVPGSLLDDVKESEGQVCGVRETKRISIVMLLLTFPLLSLKKWSSPSCGNIVRCILIHTLHLAHPSSFFHFKACMVSE